MTCKRFILLWLVIVMFSGGVMAQTYSDHIVRVYKASSKSTIEVFNKYGKVHVITWDRDSVQFEVDLKIQTTSEEKLQKLKSNISFDFTSTDYYIVAKTSFAKSRGVIDDLVDAFVPTNSVVIDYRVYVPKQATLKIDNKFGDVYLDDFNGNIDLSLANGNLKANNLSGNTTIRLNSGNGVINKIERGKVFISYSDLHIKNASKIDLETRSSTVTIDHVRELRIDSRRDKYYIDNLNQLYGDTYFSNIRLSNLKEDINLRMKYGTLSVEAIEKSFSLINLNSEYTDMDLYFIKGSAYNLDITHHADVYLKIPNAIAQTKTEELNKDEKQFLTSGKVGTGVTLNSPKVKIIAQKKCNINLLHK